MNERRCQATNQRGEPCQANPLRGESWCLRHHPDLGNERAAWNRQGGKGKTNAARARKAMPDDLKTVGDWLLQAMGDVRAGTMEPAQGNTLANLARSYVLLHAAAAGESRLSRLEEAFGEEGVA